LPDFEVTAFLAAAIGLLGLLSLCLLVFGRLGVGSIVAFLVAGIVIGQVRDIPAQTIVAVHEFAEIGIVLLLFLIGLEIQLDQLRRLGRDVLAFGVPQIILSALLIGLYAWWGFAEWEASLVLGLGFAQSSTVVVVQLLKERNELHSAWGNKAFAILLAQDLAIVPLLLLVSFMVDREGAGSAGGPWLWAVAWAVVAIVGIIVGGRYVLPRILAIAEKQKNGPAFTCVSLLGVLAAAFASESVGLSMALGTFLLGATLSTSSFGHRIADIIDPVQDTLLALFFLSVGLSVDLQVVSQTWAPLLFNVVAILLMKLIIILGLALVLRVEKGDALRLSLALAQCGEFGFVLFGTAQAGGLFTAERTTLASVIIATSMLAAPFLVRLGDRLFAGRIAAAPYGQHGEHEK
jgi:glutathione-regulated potassium-efflux system ancillary protein KefC